ncbi:BglG family transcription antiterminator [Pullulanibacillus sp. KACC 23026]|uniref:BglG family transcription antiterminator n=1 Tax=Pullulanibacillus sp. KACC 23026 TaxID=3028315 RepID=UPI0023AFB4AD|nr:BglG family transcription antiterminator [Pullulanibacillus sp. KACC 23026]WEG12891.1 BglG family transcription antiterminator [Pullulanibacillus sp. KACC 23026]
MYVSARERVIIETLLSHHEEITVKQLSDELGVSERTVHRDLKGVEDLLERIQIKLLKKAGVGIQLEGSPEKLEQLQLMLFNHSPVEYTPEERQTIILCTLLEADGPVKLVALANDLKVTMVTVSHDLDKIEDRLNKFGLSLQKKRGYGVEIIGSENSKRRAMGAIITENMDEIDFLSLVRESIQKQSHSQTDTISEKLLGLVEKQKLVIVEKIVEEVNKERGYFIADSAYIGLVVHLALALERIERGEQIKMDPHYLQSLQLSLEFPIAKRMVGKLSEVFGLEIPEAEIGYITMHLQGAKLRHDREYVMDTQNLEASEKATLLIKFVEEQYQVDLSSNFSLFSGLVTHLEPAIYRMEQNMGIHNPLLEQIKKDYKDLFDVIKQGVQAIFTNMVVPDEEIGFLVLHFGSALLSRPDEGLKALVICSTGIGTSKMLASRLKREFPEIQQLRNASLFEVDQLGTEDYDLVISTIRLLNFSRPYILVSPILNQEEITKIRTAIREKKVEVLLRKEPRPSAEPLFKVNNFKRSIQMFDEIKRISSTIFDILQGFKVLDSSKRTLHETLQEVCTSLEEEGTIQRGEAVVQALFEREQLGGLGIPQSKLALFHTRSEDVLRPVFLIVNLKTPFDVMSMSQERMPISRVLILMAPNQISHRELEILSYISALLIENRESITLFELKDEAQIAQYLSSKLNDLFNWKLKELRD